jgi:heptosyltransferase-1
VRYELLESRLREARPHRICVIKPSGLGDVIQALPLLAVLKAQYPEAEISWVINRQFANLVETHRLIDELLFYDRKGGFRAGWKLLRELRARRFDLVFDLQGLLRSGMMTLATGAPLRVGLESAREGSHLATHLSLRNTGRMLPAYQRYWRLAEVLGLKHAKSETGIRILDADREWVDEHLPKSESRILAIHAGATWVTKRWAATKFAAIASRAAREYGFQLAIIGSPNERALATAIASIIRERLPKSVADTSIYNFAGQTTLRQLAALLDSVDFLLTNDAGPMHLADAVGTPVCAIFLCTSSERSGPSGPQHRMVNCKLDCAGSYRKRCPYSGLQKMQCKEELSVENVWQAFTDMVDQPTILKFVA